MAEPYRPVPLPHRFELSDEEMLARADAVLDRMRRRNSVREFSDLPVPEAAKRKLPLSGVVTEFA